MRVVILGAWSSILSQVIINAIENKALTAEVVVAVSIDKNSNLLTLARHHGIPAHYIPLPAPTQSTGFYDQELATVIRKYHSDLIVLIGYTRILSAPFINCWPHKIINIHGSLLPKYAGLMGLETQKAVLQAGDKQAGCTIHFVTEQVDAGPILLQRTCPVCDDDTPTTLRKKITELGKEAYISALNLISQKYSLSVTSFFE